MSDHNTLLKVVITERKKQMSQEPKQELTSFATGAVRGTDRKGVRYDLISPIALKQVAETYAEGCAKYGEINWLKGIPFSDLINHAQCHIELFKIGDTSENHMAHAIWNLMTIIHFMETMPKMDDRIHKKDAQT